MSVVRGRGWTLVSCAATLLALGASVAGGCGDDGGDGPGGGGGGDVNPPLGGGGSEGKVTVEDGPEYQPSGAGGGRNPGGPGGAGGAGGGGGSDFVACPGAPTLGEARGSFAGTLATAQYVDSMFAVGNVPSLLSLDYEDLRDSLDEVPLSRFDAWLEHPTENTVTLEVRTESSEQEILLDELAVLIDASPSNATIDALRRAVLLSLARKADDAGVGLKVYSFADEATLLGAASPGQAEALVPSLEITPSEGHNLAKALSSMSHELNGNAHVLVLTDAGFTPTQETLLKIDEMQRSEKSQRVSIAQLANLEGFSTGSTGSRTELRRSTLRPIAARGQGFALFLHDRDVVCADGLCTHAAVEEGFDFWFATFAPAPTLQILLPAGLTFTDVKDSEPSEQPAKQLWVPSKGTVELSLTLELSCMPDIPVTLTQGEEQTSTFVLSEQPPASPRAPVDDRLRTLVGAMRSQTSVEDPGQSACDALQALPVWSSPCANAAGSNVPPAVCTYADNVDAFYDRAKAALCPSP